MSWVLPVAIIVGFLMLIVGLTIELRDEADHPHERGQFGRWN